MTDEIMFELSIQVVSSSIHLSGFLFLGFDVGLDVELGKQKEKRKDVEHVGGRNGGRQILASIDQQVGALRHHCDELNHLQQGEVRLPPDGKGFSGRGVLGVHTDEIVSVHDGMDKSVQNNRKINITVVKDIGVEPIEKKDGNVMVDVQERKLSPLLSQNDENSVPKIPNLRNVEQPQKIGQCGLISVVADTRGDGIIIAVSQEKRLDGHVRAKHYLGHIVHELDGVGIDGWSIGHNLRTNDDEQKVCESNSEGSGKVCQGPSLQRRSAGMRFPNDKAQLKGRQPSKITFV